LKRGLDITEKALGPDHPDVAVLFSNLAELAFSQSDWVKAASYLRRSTSIIRRRSERGFAVGRLGDARGEAWRLAAHFWALIKAENRIAAQGRSARAAPLAEMFETVQWAQASEAAASLAQMAARSAGSSSELGGLVRERQDLVNEWQTKDKELIIAKSKEPTKRVVGAENALADRLAAIDIRLEEIGRRFAKDFPEYAALASPAPASITEVQAQLGADEALVLFLDTPEIKPVPEETFVWIVTKGRCTGCGQTLARRRSPGRWLHCGVASMLWDGRAPS